MKSSPLLSLLLLLCSSIAPAAVVPGFSVKFLGAPSGFPTSIVVDSRGTIYYTTTKGDVFRFADGQSMPVAHVNTEANGDSGLLGMALRDDLTAVVHYTTPNQTADVISSIDLTTGAETILHSFVCDVDVPQRGSSSEHHGGNPTVGADGSIFFGIGDYNNGNLAPDMKWNAGKIFRIHPNGEAEVFASGFRNPFDMSWDAPRQRLIATDNGEAVDDEINIVTAGGFYGWPFTMGNGPPVAGAIPPIYTFPMIIAPTGLAALDGRNPILRNGYLLASFVTSAIYFIPDIDARPLPAPIALIEGETKYIIDVTEGPGGEVYFVAPGGIYKLNVPLRGDCNGDGVVSAADYELLLAMIASGPRPMTAASTGGVRGTWGCDVNGDGLIDARDAAQLRDRLNLRLRAVR